jgi:hypothetical protein
VSKKAKPAYRLKVRRYPEGAFVDVWLVCSDGAAEAGLLWGELLPGLAARLALTLGLPVEYDDSPCEGFSPVPVRGCAAVAAQKELFPEEGATP